MFGVNFWQVEIQSFNLTLQQWSKGGKNSYKAEICNRVRFEKPAILNSSLSVVSTLFWKIDPLK